jgi:hypothetical protein
VLHLPRSFHKEISYNSITFSFMVLENTVFFCLIYTKPLNQNDQTHRHTGLHLCKLEYIYMHLLIIHYHFTKFQTTNYVKLWASQCRYDNVTLSQHKRKECYVIVSTHSRPSHNQMHISCFTRG